MHSLQQWRTTHYLTLKTFKSTTAELSQTARSSTSKLSCSTSAFLHEKVLWKGIEIVLLMLLLLTKVPECPFQGSMRTVRNALHRAYQHNNLWPENQHSHWVGQRLCHLHQLLTCCLPFLPPAALVELWGNPGARIPKINDLFSITVPKHNLKQNRVSRNH